MCENIEHKGENMGIQNFLALSPKVFYEKFINPLPNNKFLA